MKKNKTATKIENEEFAAEIIDIIRTENSCTKCGGDICDVYLKVLSGKLLGEIQIIPTCVRRDCGESQSMLMPLH